MKAEQKAYEEKPDAQSKEWGGENALLKAKMDKTKADAKIEFYRAVQALRMAKKMELR